MTRRQRRLSALVGRAVSAAAATALAAVLLSPAAAATPESDAADAITAAWKDGGGPSSVLGDKQGDVYPVGDGFAQDFAGGKMFFTPATGAKAIYGGILDKYESLGGPAGSDLGFPTINEVPGLAGPDSRVSTFSASDKPVIFWTPDHGAFVVRGAMNAAWDKLGSSGGALGVPVGDETYNGEVVTQPFSGGKVSWNRLTKVFTTTPPELAQQLTGLQVNLDPTAAINMAWRAAGGAGGPLGAKQGGQYPVGADGLGQNFAGGKVFFSPATGANAIESNVLAKYESLGGPVGSDLGFPTASEADGGIAASRVSPFSAADKPVIFWTHKHGAFVVRGAMRAAWDKLGGAKGKLGPPIGDQAVAGDVITQRFAGGKISWNRAKNTFTTEPSNLASSLSGLQVPGQKQPSQPAAAAGGGKPTWHWWWLLVAIPALLLLGILALTALRRPGHRRAAGREFPVARPGRQPAVTPAYDDATDADRHWPADTDSEVHSSQFSQRYAEPHSAEPQEPHAEPREPYAEPQEPSVPVGEPEHSAWTREAGIAAASAAVTSERHAEDAPVDDQQDVEAEDPDAVDTAPTRIPSAAELSGGRHAATDPAEEAEALPGEPNARGPARLAMHLPLDDPYEVPDGYPVKANASFGLYYTPGSTLYDDTLAEVFFVSEEAAQANGFNKAG